LVLDPSGSGATSMSMSSHAPSMSFFFEFAGEADGGQLRMTEGGYFLDQGGGVDHGSIDGCSLCLFPQRLLDDGLDVEVAHGLFEGIETVERYLQVGQVGAENRSSDLRDYEYDRPPPVTPPLTSRRHGKVSVPR
jgi:hypothetical protein